MVNLKSLLDSHNGRIYVYLVNRDSIERFLRYAEAAGFTFKNGEKPDECVPNIILEVNNDFTLNYVGFVGYINPVFADKISSESLFKINCTDFVRQNHS